MKTNSLQIEIDGIDKEILRDLMIDARKPILQIANKIGISGAAIHQRLRKLESSGVISGSKFTVNNKVLGYSTMAFVGVYLDKAASNPEAVRELKKIPEVLECNYTKGNWRGAHKKQQSSAGKIITRSAKKSKVLQFPTLSFEQPCSQNASLARAVLNNFPNEICAKV